MKASRLILVKHALPEIVAGVPAAEWSLAASGRAAAKRLADRLLPYAPASVVTSDEPKAAETGRIVATRLGVPVRPEPGLHEHDRRDVGWLGAEQFERSVGAFFGRPSQLVFGAETADGARARFSAAIERVLAAEPATVVVVAHGTVIALVVAQKNGVEPLLLWKRLGLPSFVVLSRPDLQLEEIVEDAA